MCLINKKIIKLINCLNLLTNKNIASIVSQSVQNEFVLGKG